MSKVACITLDMEPDHGDPEKRIRLLDNPEFFEQYISIINRHSAKVTMFTVTSLFADYGEKLRALGRRIPLEWASHSHHHDPYDACSPAEIDTAHNAFEEFTGSPPRGYRAPIGRITPEGLEHLIKRGYQFDASLYPSVRPGEFGYFNLRKPNVPFRVRHEDGALIELPFTAISTVRIVFGLSYAKLFGWSIYSTLLKVFGLPDAVLALSHPYDFYTHLVAGGLAGMEKLALTRNARSAFDYFEKMLIALEERGYQFTFVSELCAQLDASPALPELALEAWNS